MKTNSSLLRRLRRRRRQRRSFCLLLPTASATALLAHLLLPTASATALLARSFPVESVVVVMTRCSCRVFVPCRCRRPFYGKVSVFRWYGYVSGNGRCLVLVRDAHSGVVVDLLRYLVRSVDTYFRCLGYRISEIRVRSAELRLTTFALGSRKYIWKQSPYLLR